MERVHRRLGRRREWLLRKNGVEGVPCLCGVLSSVLTVSAGLSAATPDLAAGCGVVVEQEHAASVMSGGRGGSDTCRSCSDDNDFSVIHRCVSTTMPLVQIN